MFHLRQVANCSLELVWTRRFLSSIALFIPMQSPNSLLHKKKGQPKKLDPQRIQLQALQTDHLNYFPDNQLSRQLSLQESIAILLRYHNYPISIPPQHNQSIIFLQQVNNVLMSLHRISLPRGNNLIQFQYRVTIHRRKIHKLLFNRI